ncbi:GNAT family N-acetyltransferase [Roseomonas haemaphysalidis]|uniref:GNAT family N-acetyltransferase n=1 Tax=Roseomonas haemaphysalidis TaxID=2768162 RepID=UPI001A9666B8|nr:GNAT family N-acetyltransferase [Roseomonas haemaphysalidis]
MYFQLTEDRDGPDARAVGENLSRHRTQALGAAPVHQPLVLLHHGPDGALLAGLVAEVVLDWLFVEKFWVSEALRGQGVGSAMLAQAEAEARKRGAVGVHLYTSSFQAPAFYRRHGFTPLGTLAGRPAGHTRFWFGKRFDGGDPRES